jgi:hypothetical protein
VSTENPETDSQIILSDDIPLELASGFPIKVERLKTRATLALLRIMLRGAGDVLFSGQLDPNDEGFQQQLVFAVLFSIPEAPDETLDFLRVMVKPGQLREAGRITKGDEAWNEEQWDLLRKELEDPELEDLIDIVVQIVKNEGPHIQALGKKLTALATTMGRSLQKNSSDESAPKKSSKRASKATTPTAS